MHHNFKLYACLYRNNFTLFLYWPLANFRSPMDVSTCIFTMRYFITGIGGGRIQQHVVVPIAKVVGIFHVI